MKKNKNLLKLLLLIVLMITAKSSYSMNDTDGVVAKGIFPLNEGSRFLKIDSEKIEITITDKGTVIKKLYKIQNNGKRNTFKFGMIYCYNCLSEANDSDTKIQVDGTIVEHKKKFGYLKDVGTHVDVKEMTKKEISEGLEYVDGTIVGHLWGVFELEFNSKQIRQIELKYFEAIPHEGFPGRILNNFSIYTEKFWSEPIIPLIEFNLKIKNNIIPLKYFIPNGDYDSKSPDIIKDKELIWQFKNYKISKQMYTYTYQFIHPFAIERKKICEEFKKITGSQISCFRCY
ncbi:MAG: hypothetical protein ACMUJM_24880 [bacterium]